MYEWKYSSEHILDDAAFVDTVVFMLLLLSSVFVGTLRELCEEDGNCGVVINRGDPVLLLPPMKKNNEYICNIQYCNKYTAAQRSIAT